MQASINSYVSTVESRLKDKALNGHTYGMTAALVDKPIADNQAVEHKAMEELRSKYTGLTFEFTSPRMLEKAEIRVEGDLSVFLDANELKPQVKALVVWTAEQIKTAVSTYYSTLARAKANNEDIEVVIKNIDKKGPSGVVWLARREAEQRLNIKFKDLPSGHGGSRDSIGVIIVDRNFDRFIS